MIRPIAMVAGGTLASRVTGFIRDALVAALLGAGAVADAFLIAFQLVTLVRRLLTEGALNAAFVPAWLRVRRAGGDGAAAAFAGRALGVLGLGVACIAALVALAAPALIARLAPGFDAAARDAAVLDARLMLPYLAFAGPVAVLIALANAQRRVALSAAAPVLFNAAMVAACVLLLWHTVDPIHAALIVAATVGVAGLLQLALLAGANRDATPIRFTPDAGTRALLGRALPGMIASAGPQLLIVGGAIVASRAPSAVSWLYFASRLIDLPLGIVSTVSGAVLVTEAAHAAADRDAARRAQGHAIGAAMALALPAAIGLFVLARPIVQAVFARGAFTADDADQTARTLQMLALGLPAQALVKALAPSFFARGDTLTPMAATLAGLALAFGAAAMVEEIMGIAAAVSLGSAVAAAVLLVRHGDVRTREGRLVRVALAAAAMGAALLAVRDALPSDAVATLAVLIPLGLGVYAAALLVFGAIRPAELRAAWRRRDLRQGEARGTGTPTPRTQDIDT